MEKVGVYDCATRDDHYQQVERAVLIHVSDGEVGLDGCWINPKGIFVC